MNAKKRKSLGRESLPDDVVNKESQLLKIVRAKSSLPSMVSSLLIVGCHGIGKKNIASTLEKMIQATRATSTVPRRHLDLSIHLASKLPLDKKENRKRLDAIVLMVNMSSCLSLEIAKESLAFISTEDLVHRCVLLVARAKDISEEVFEMEKIYDIANSLDLPIYFVNLRDPKSLGQAGKRLISLTETINRKQNGVSPNLLSSIDYL